MIKEFKCYTLLCDNCGADVNEDSEVSGWDSEEYNYDIAGESEPRPVHEFEPLEL